MALTTTSIERRGEEETLPAVRDEWTPERLALVKRTYCRGASDDEFALFVDVCRRTGLSPLAKQVYCIMRANHGVQEMTIQVSIDGFRLIADRTGRYVPGRECSYTYDEKGNLETATAYVKKLVAGEWHEASATVRWKEFKGTSSFWNDMPHHQLGKVAEAHTLRRAFPADLSGLYAPEEMEQADRTPVARIEEARLLATAPPERTTMPVAPAESAPGTNTCAECGKSITGSRKTFCEKNRPRVLCIPCEEKGTSEA